MYRQFNPFYGTEIIICLKTPPAVTTCASTEMGTEGNSLYIFFKCETEVVPQTRGGPWSLYASHTSSSNLVVNAEPLHFLLIEEFRSKKLYLMSACLVLLPGSSLLSLTQP